MSKNNNTNYSLMSEKLKRDNKILTKKLEEQNAEFIKVLQLEKKELKDKLHIEQNYSKQVINNAGTIVGISISTLQYIIQNYNTIENDSFYSLKELDDQFIKGLLKK